MIKKTNLIVQNLIFNDFMAKNTGLDFDFGARFGAIENKLETVIIAVDNINSNFTTKFNGLEERTGNLEKYKNKNEIDIKWICAIGGVLIVIVGYLMNFASGVAQGVVTEKAKTQFIGK